MLSFFFSWSSDQSEIKTIFDSSTEIKNIGKKFGLLISYYLIYKGFGLGAILIPSLMFLIGISLTFNSGLDKILSRSIFLLLSMVWISLFSSYIFSNNIYGGVFGYEIKSIIIEFMGDLGFISILVFGFISFLIIKFKKLKKPSGRNPNIFNSVKLSSNSNHLIGVNLMLECPIHVLGLNLHR